MTNDPADAGESHASSDAAPPPSGDGETAKEPVRFASPVTVKRTKKSYGVRGILALTDSSLIFLTAQPKKSSNWVLPRTSIAKVRKPWYGMGSYLTFEGAGAYYALAFGRNGTTTLVSASDLSVMAGGVGIPLGIIGDAMAVSRMRQSAKLGNEWNTRLRS
jgi:hypothetical protein